MSPAKTLLTLVVSFATWSAQAQMLPLTAQVPLPLEGQCTENCQARDYFSELHLMYSTAQMPATESLNGWFAGRCYFNNSRSVARNTVFVGWNELIGSGNGPAFPPTEIFKGLWIASHDKPADYYDTLSPQAEAGISQYLMANRHLAIQACEQNGAILTGQQGTYWSIRQTVDYLLMQAYINNQVFAYCYTFKKIK